MRPNAQIVFEDLRSRHSDILSKFDPDRCIELFDRLPPQPHYTVVPDAVRDGWAAIVSEFGEAGFDALQRMTMLRLIENFEARAAGKNYADGILECFDHSFARIVRSVADPDFDKYRTENDVMMKDLALCRQIMFPAGMRIVEPDSGFHRSLMFRAGATQAVRLAWLLAASGGNDHWFQVHTHPSELHDFNAAGWERCAWRLAQMLKLYPDIRGVFTGSWFNDPEIVNISPRLTYLRKMPQDNGAVVLFNQIEDGGGAIAKSATRRRLYEEGMYQPKSYFVVWPRRRLLRWAEKFHPAPEPAQA